MPIKIPGKCNERWRLPLLYDLFYLRDAVMVVLTTDIPKTDIDFMLNVICCD